MSIVLYRAQPARHVGLLRLLAQWLVEARQRLAEAGERRRLRRASLALATASERTLRDIGLERCRLRHGMPAGDARPAGRFLRHY